jgi:hypothetical protein
MAALHGVEGSFLNESIVSSSSSLVPETDEHESIMQYYI